MVPIVRRAVRWRYAIVAATFLVCALIGDQSNGDLEFFTQALKVLGTSGSAGGLHLYAVRPDVQIGPLAILGVGVLDGLFFGKIVLAVVVGALVLLLVTVHLLERLARAQDVPAERVGVVTAVGGSVLAAAYAVAVPGWGHLDDLAALTATVASLYAGRRSRPVLAGLLLAVATGCKPWAAFVWPMLLILPAGGRTRGLGAFVAGSLVCWLPFVVGAPQTLHALSAFSMRTVAGSLPFQLGYTAAPSWVRPGQLALTAVLVLVCVRARRFDLVLLAAAVGRLVLDAGVFPYYAVELVLGCLVADVLAAGRSRLTACAPTCLAAWLAVTAIDDLALTSTQAFVARTTLYVGLLAAAMCRRPRRVPSLPVVPPSLSHAAPALID